MVSTYELAGSMHYNTLRRLKITWEAGISPPLNVDDAELPIIPSTWFFVSCISLIDAVVDTSDVADIYKCRFPQ